MEALGINLKFLLIQIANFALFAFLFTKFLLKPILKVLDERKKRVAEGLEAAEKSKEELAGIENSKVEAKRKMKSEEKKLLDEAKVKVDKESAIVLFGAKKQAEKMIKDAAANIKNIENEERRKMKVSELQIIERVIEKILDQKLDDINVKARYQKVMDELYKEV